MIEIVAPQLRTGGHELNNNAEPDFLEFIRDPANGFISITIGAARDKRSIRTPPGGHEQRQASNADARCGYTADGETPRGPQGLHRYGFIDCVALIH